MPRATRWNVMVLMAALLLLGSCVKLEQKPVDKRFYALEVARPGAAVTTSASAATLLVRRLQVSPRVSGRELVYRTGESAWTADFYNLFFVIPADMLTQDLRTWLGSAGLFANVVDPSSLLLPGYILEGNVSGLHGDFGAKPAQAVAEIQFILLRNVGSERCVIMTRDIRKSVPLAANTPAELVRSLRQAVTEINAELEGAIREAVSRQ
ncbi:MAG: ABC-type transport auxiliary lipoprotein family protein [Humidesulfovibrio sp.]|uniref:PqiC family protein n=1 Tax=Humidesulfovibrio sp. TaxID=2910988 RepID=UPI0027FD106A|nr:ABC-type transport auxiliary lipoprotein family protein [Humidesulfovibrio sp.]MDQ7834126.1 ABC-type transport auxiliary lipoprotein family protein [Humidesulfovibrio sp.]